MKEINNLTYELQIQYLNNDGVNVVICKKLYDTGLETKFLQIGDIAITEETINGRVLSGRYDNQQTYCGYRYDYKNNHEQLININEEIPLETAISLINKSKMTPAFLSALLVQSSIMTDDYRVFSVNEGNIKIINSVTAENEEGKQYTFQESISLFRVKGDKYFNEVDSERMYIIDGNIFLMSGNNEGDDIELQFKELVEVSHQKPYKIKQLIDLKHNLQSECVL